MGIRLENVSYQDKIKNISYEFEDGKITTVIGSSSSGKTLLSYLLSGIIEALIVAGYEEVSKLLDSKIRPRILANRKHEQLLEALKEKQFITSYELNEKSGIYNYTRSSKKRNNFPTELL